LQDTGYSGTVAMEGWASGDSTAALQQFRDHFTL
ncbi:hydroxypyruvate isomerase, partial [Klebsiella quasipneumoniae subsp. similipneumoniae]